MTGSPHEDNHIPGPPPAPPPLQLWYLNILYLCVNARLLHLCVFLEIHLVVFFFFLILVSICLCAHTVVYGGECEKTTLGNGSLLLPWALVWNS